jgi:guanylate kinase
MSRFFIISGPSGVGKGTLIKQLLLQKPDIHLAVSATTRPIRNGEVSGKDYHFFSKQAFQNLIQQHCFMEWCEVHQAYYGTLNSEVEQPLRLGKCVLLEIDVQGAKKIKQIRPDVGLIFILPPSLDVLSQRLKHRSSETEDVIKKRLDVAKLELEQSEFYDYLVVNDDVSRAVNRLISIMG